MAPRRRKRESPEPPIVDDPFRRMTRSMIKKRKIQTGQGSTAAVIETGQPSEPVGTAVVAETGQASEPVETAAVSTETGQASEPDKTSAVVTETGAVSESEKTSAVTETGDGSAQEKTASLTETGDGSESEMTAAVIEAGDGSKPAAEEKGKTITTTQVEGAASGSASKGPTIIVEHCKIGKKFKERAVELQKVLEEAVPDITVLLNPEPPRKGFFEIRMEGGEIFISLSDLKRPFTPLAELNMEEVVASIVAKINA